MPLKASLLRIKPLSTLKRKSRTNGLHFSPDGERLVSASYRAVAISNPITGKVAWEKSFDEVGQAITARFSPEGECLLIGGTRGNAVLVDAKTKKLVGSHSIRQVIHSLCFSRDGKQFLVGGKPDAFWWTVGKPKPTAVLPGKAKRHPDAVRNVAFLADETAALFTYWDTLVVWRLGKKPTQSYKAVDRLGRPGAAPQPDGTIVTMNRRGELHAVDAFRKKKRPLNTLESVSHLIDPVTKLAVSGDGARALVGRTGGQITLWDLASGTCIAELRGHKEEGIDALAFSPDGTRAASSSLDFNVHVWKLPS
jgi:WD40 repeat protein